MLNLSIWSCNAINSLDQVRNKIFTNGYIRNTAPSEDDERIYMHKIYNKPEFEQNNTIIVNSEEIKFLVCNVRIEWLKREWDNSISSQSGIGSFEKEVIFYEYNGCVKLLIIAARTNALKIKRDIFKEEVWGEIVESNYINEDLLYWLFYRLHNFELTEELSPNSGLYLTGLKSYMGKTRDEVNAVRGSGVRISALLGTLSFIFNNEDLRALRPEFQYNGSLIVTELNKNNVNRLVEKSCMGQFDEYDDEKRNIAILIFTANVIIPKIQECYQESLNNNTWSIDIKLTFFQEIGRTIRSAVDTELQRIEQQRDHVNVEFNEDDVDEEIDNEEFIEE